ncbi:hypothetical protein KUTeg_001537 [Tegillarca granosa]|uniref:G-protein coupled receptors family 1 profile domain-containing protein n=1 Tax=Tegillarca granosa TaxID=220873 RepID=A0ABQ9FW42_TEGGR|nr:hypothetical protein KUTeg_001537 [Tegillarca granosa]
MAYSVEMYACIAMLAIFSSVGIIGNGLVLFGFSKSQQKLTSTVFILTLAVIDFVTCLVTIPFTIAMEALKFHVSYDTVCKLYHFMIATTIPFSAFIMVAIAVDRYFCICHPFWKLMNIYRARVIVSCLGLFSFLLGLVWSLNYGVYLDKNNLFTTIIDNNDTYDPKNDSTYKLPKQSKNADDTETLKWKIKQLLSHFRGNESIDLNNITEHPYNTGKCAANSLILGQDFATVYQRIYSSFYAICCVIVIILYIVLYRFILSRRRKRLRTESFPCCAFKTHTPSENENTEVIFLSHDGTTPAEEPNVEKEKSIGENEKDKEKCLKPRNHSKNVQKVKNSVRAKQEKILINNIKTAFMLSIVASVFIFAFLPAWLMKYNVIPSNIVLFNMYFVYNVVNPFIYAFMNKDFRQQLKEICKK